jgi:hypothetical protein
MRSALVLGLLITLCYSADAATVHHVRTRHHHHVTSSFAESWAYEPDRPTVHDDDTPSYNDPSKFGGSTALPIQ